MSVRGRIPNWNGLPATNAGSGKVLLNNTVETCRLLEPISHFESRIHCSQSSDLFEFLIARTHLRAKDVMSFQIFNKEHLHQADPWAGWKEVNPSTMHAWSEMVENGKARVGKSSS